MVSDHQRLSVKNPQLQSTLFYEHSYLSETLTSRIQAITRDYKPPHLCKSDPVDCTTCDPWLQIGLSMEDCSAEGKRSQCWFVFSLSPCFLSMYLEMSSSSFRAHLHWVLEELFLTLILTLLSQSLWLDQPTLCTKCWSSILTNFLFFSDTLSCPWPLLSPDFNYHSYVIKYLTSTALSHAFPGEQWPMCHVGTHWTPPLDAPQTPPHHRIQQ